MTIVVDDHVLFDVLAGHAPPEVEAELQVSGLFTTSTWCYRLGRAIHGGGSAGSLFRRLQALAPERRRLVANELRRLPDEIGLLGPRVSVPVMIGLRVRRPLNLLNAEALAAAVVLDAALVVATDSPLLRGGADDLGVPYTLLS